MSIDTEYCNKCGLLHNPDDGTCLGCKQQKDIQLLRMMYLGVLALLGECSVFVDEDIRDSIEQALSDGQEAKVIKYRRVLNRFNVEVYDDS